MSTPASMSRRDLGKITVGAMAGVTLGCLRLPAGPVDDSTPDSQEGNAAGRANELTLRREILFDRPSLGPVTDLRIDPQTGRVAIAGRKEAVQISAAGKVVSAVAFPVRTTQVRFLDATGENRPGFLDTGGIGWQDAALFSPEGRVLWTFGSSSHPDQEAVNATAIGDLDGDEKVDLVIGCNGSGGVLRLDLNGNVVWRQPDGNVWHVEVADVDGDGTAEIIHSNAGGQITVRDAAGKIRQQSQPQSYFSEFSLCRWPSRESKPQLLTPSEDHLQLLTMDGNVVVTLEAPGCSEHSRAIGTLVRFAAPGPEYLAVVTTNDRRDSRLFVYDRDKTLMHHERLDGDGYALAILPGEGGTESVLVGGEGKVWRYRRAR